MGTDKSLSHGTRSTVASVEAALEDVVARSPLGRYVDPRRVVRLVEFAAVGATGAALDLLVTVATIGGFHYLAANVVGFGVANSWNFNLHRLVTFDDTDGPFWRQYRAYMSLHVATFAIRAAVVVALVELVGVPPVPSSFIGIGAAAIANYLGSEWIFIGKGSLWSGVGAGVNRLAHALYTTRVQTALDRTGLYHPLYVAYQRVLGRLYSDDVLDVEVAGASATFHMEHDPEVLSVFHTLRKERAMLDDFVAAVGPDDVVWDVGANLGVFACLAAARGARVIAFEPFWPTAGRLDENADLSDVDVEVYEFALGREEGSVDLGVDRKELGTQTPTIEPRDGQATTTVAMFAGDELVDDDFVPAPTVAKIDVEGAELDVVDGLQDALARPACRLVYTEDHSHVWGRDETVGQLRARLERLGFAVDEVEQHNSQTYLKGEKS